MDLGNDECTFSYGEMNEANYDISHMQEEHTMEDGGMYLSCNSNDKGEIIMIQNVDDLKDPMLWEKFEKDVEDFTIEEVRKLRFKSLELCGEFYKFYAKIKGFGVRENGARKSRVDGHPTSRIYKCSAEGFRDQKHVQNSERVRTPKPLTRCLCEAQMRFKWIRDVDYWIVTKFETKHTHCLAKPSDVLYIRYEFSVAILYV